MKKKILALSNEVAKALATGKAVVALESTIISHGMPYPKNVETALEVEETVRAAGAIPATIAVIDGQLKAGLSKTEITYLGKKGREAIKCSRRDLPFVVAKKMTGATTVAATMIIADMVGISIFATGGIGGVHRGATQSMDISADLQELAKTSVAVISAGVKSILDLPLTLEYLETQGVPVIGYQTTEFPAFYSRKSGLSVDYRLDTPAEIAKALAMKWDLDLKGGVIIANPIPAAHEMKYQTINEAIEKALDLAAKKGVKGKDITPYLLAKVEELTQGESLRSNIQLVLNNARLAARIAASLVDMK